MFLHRKPQPLTRLWSRHRVTPLPRPSAAQAHQLCSRALHLSPARPSHSQELPLPCRAPRAACSPSQPPELREGLLEVVSGTWGRGTEQELSRYEGGAPVCPPEGEGLLHPQASSAHRGPGTRVLAGPLAAWPHKRPSPQPRLPRHTARLCHASLPGHCGLPEPGLAQRG